MSIFYVYRPNETQTNRINFYRNKNLSCCDQEKNIMTDVTIIDSNYDLILESNQATKFKKTAI